MGVMLFAVLAVAAQLERDYIWAKTTAMPDITTKLTAGGKHRPGPVGSRRWCLLQRFSMSLAGVERRGGRAVWRGARHHTILVVDVEGFGDRRRTNQHHRAVRDGLYRVVQKAFVAAGVPWNDCYHEDRGDAVFLLAPAEVDKSVFVETLPSLLVTALRVHNDTHPEAQRIRLRIALHAGEVHYDDHGVTSASLTLAFRLNDAAPLRAALAASPGVLAVITSGWFFDDVVRHTPGAAPATWRPVDVAVKETTTTGWITLPDHPYPADTLPSTGASASGRVVPRQLPLAVRDFTGRADHLAALDALLPPESSQRDGQASAVVISAVDGTADIGKTTLAVHWAHRVQRRFPDGTLHINLRGYGPGDPTTPIPQAVLVSAAAAAFSGTCGDVVHQMAVGAGQGGGFVAVQRHNLAEHLVTGGRRSGLAATTTKAATPTCPLQVYRRMLLSYEAVVAERKAREGTRCLRLAPVRHLRTAEYLGRC